MNPPSMRKYVFRAGWKAWDIDRYRSCLGGRASRIVRCTTPMSSFAPTGFSMIARRVADEREPVAIGEVRVDDDEVEERMVRAGPSE